MSAILWVTTDCNLACRYCYEGDSKPRLKMSIDTVEKSIEFMVDTLKYVKDKTIIIPIHGGEPFLEFNTIKYIVKRCKEAFIDKDIIFPITTNGTVLNTEMLDFIKNNSIDITLSIDGTSDTHNKMRPFKNGKGSHAIVLENGKKLLHNSPEMRVRVTFDSETVCYLYDDIKFLIDQGFKCIAPAPNLFDKRWNESHIKTLERQLIKIKKYIENTDEVLVSMLDKNLYSVKGPCMGGMSSFNIYPNGDIYPCTLTVGNDEFCIGNIYNEVDKNKRDKLLSYSACENEDCSGCGLSGYCSGSRCKMVNKLLTNDYCLPSPVECTIEHLKYKLNFK